MIRELDRRTTPEGDVVVLSWNDESDSIELHLEPAGGTPETAEVPRDRALDAFRHPYVYLARYALAPSAV